MAIKDWYYDANLSQPGIDLFAVTPADAVFANGVVCRALYVGGAGNVAINTAKGNTVTLTSIPAGTFIPIIAQGVWSTGTTATNIVGII